MKRREYMTVTLLALAGCTTPQDHKPEDLQAQMYSHINETRKMYDREPLERDPELESSATSRAVDIDADDKRVTEVGHDSDVSAAVKADMVVYSWITDEYVRNVVLNSTISHLGVGVYQENDKCKIAVSVQ